MARHTRPGRRLAFHHFALCPIHVHFSEVVICFYLRLYFGIPVLVPRFHPL